MSRRVAALIGDGIENPWNARTMLHAAQMFGCECLFRDERGLTEAWQALEAAAESRPNMEPLPLISDDEIRQGRSPLIAFDNLPGAANLYGFRLPRAPRAAVIVGNERLGVSKRLQSMADHAVQRGRRLRDRALLLES